MRRALVPGVVILAALVAYRVFVRPEPAHISELVPVDFSFGVFSRSLNDLRQLYEGPYARSDADPAQLRFGRPCNVPGLDGVDYDAPAGSFVAGEHGDEIFLMPLRDARAFEDAFDRERENTRMREPERVAKDYVSLSEQRKEARPGRRNDLVLAAARYPLALCGRPKDGGTLKAMLIYLLGREAPGSAPLLAKEVMRLPTGIADTIARECEDLLLGFPLPDEPQLPVTVVGEAALVPEGMIARSAHLASKVDLTDVAASFPDNTVLLAGLVLDARAWQDIGLPLPVGDAAFACGLVEQKIHARRFTLLLAARPYSKHDLARLKEKEQGLAPLVGETAGLTWTKVEDGSAVVETAALKEPPGWLTQVLRSDAATAPPVYVSTAVERGIWYCAIGSQAEGTVRRALGCLRDMPQLGLARVRPVAQHKAFLASPHVGLALVTAAGLKAFDRTMPYFEVASLAQPPALTAVLDVDPKAKLEILIGRTER